MPIDNWDKLALYGLTFHGISFLEDNLQSCCSSRDVRGMKSLKCIFSVLVLGLKTVDKFERRVTNAAVITRTVGEDHCGKMFGPFRWCIRTEFRQSFNQTTVQALNPPVRLRMVSFVTICCRPCLT